MNSKKYFWREILIKKKKQFCLSTVDVASCHKVCSYQDVLDYLNLTTDNSVFKLTRPVLDYTHPTTVQLDIILYAILAVVGAALLHWCLNHELNATKKAICTEISVFTFRLRKHKLLFPLSGQPWWVCLFVCLIGSPLSNTKNCYSSWGPFCDIM